MPRPDHGPGAPTRRVEQSPEEFGTAPREETASRAGAARGGDGSSAPDADGSPAARPGKAALPTLGLRGTLRFLWRQLTSMQTALFLLMLLAIAAIPGSLYPQRNVNPALTDQYLADAGGWGEFLDSIGMFDVFSSPWFSAIYLLLFISLIGCIIPRTITHARHLRSRPPRTPSRLGRFVGYTRLEVPSATPDELADAARTSLRGRRYRADRLEEKGGRRSVTSERGYLRETGNLLFHLALLGVLIGVAGGHLTQYRGQITIVEGEGFSNNLTRYDTFQSGPWFDQSELSDFQFTLEEFRAEFSTEPGEHEFGQPRSFEADVRVTEPVGGTREQTVRVNEPLRVPGATMYLLGNGYAPDVTVTDPEGEVVAQGPIITVPRGDMGYTSQLVLKAPDARPDQLAIVGLFLPTGVIDESGPHSRFPALVDPQLAMSVHTGDLGLDDGVPQNVYEIDVSTLEPVADETGAPALLNLRPGEDATLPDGTTIAFDGVKRYAAFDIKHDAFAVPTLVMSLLAVAGLVLSLYVPRRRIWVRATPAADGTGSVLEVAGLARSDDPRLASDVQELAASLGGGVRSDDPHPTDPPGSSTT
ncbi:MAG: cytochrome c biogenesis protein ResB [Brachybacterium sp.]|nr:cytochrome c biogenesis protein ResB [Brachybacterium sp.]